MSERTTTRRTVLRACGAACLGVPAAAASAGEASAEPNSESTAATDASSLTGRSGTYRGTVDRIVDGEHVVVLVEEGSHPARQFVFDRDELPSVEEGESLWLWLWRGRVVHIW